MAARLPSTNIQNDTKAVPAHATDPIDGIHVRLRDTQGLHVGQVAQLCSPHQRGDTQLRAWGWGGTSADGGGGEGRFGLAVLSAHALLKPTKTHVHPLRGHSAPPLHCTMRAHVIVGTHDREEETRRATLSRCLCMPCGITKNKQTGLRRVGQPASNTTRHRPPSGPQTQEYINKITRWAAARNGRSGEVRVQLCTAN